MTEQTFGSKAQVWHGTAKKTVGGLTKNNLMKNKHGRIVSKKKHSLGKKSIKNLKKMGYVAKKGKFVLFHKNHKKTHKRSRKMRGGVATNIDTNFNKMPTQNTSMTSMMPKKGGRKMSGGMTYGGPLSPHSYNGQGEGTSGVALQFVAGNSS
jgi:hypothetical protein